jgi:hypothetical protein
MITLQVVCIVLGVLIANTRMYSKGTETTPTKAKYILADIDKTNLPVSDKKISAGLSLALELTDSMMLLSSKVTDSTARSIIQSGTVNPTAVEIAKRLNADGIISVKLGKIHHVVRAEVQIARAPFFNEVQIGVGYSVARYRKAPADSLSSKANTEQSEAIVYDPAILSSIQRALCTALKDSSLYKQLSGELNVKPAPLLAIGGIEFANITGVSNWLMFRKSTITSYDMTLSVMETAMKSSDYVCVDTDSRDSIYALFKLFGVENDKQTTGLELDALRKIEVQYCITGTLLRTEKGAKLMMELNMIEPGNTLRAIRAVEGELNEDNFQTLRIITKKCTRILLGMPEPNDDVKPNTNPTTTTNNSNKKSPKSSRKKQTRP